MKGNTMARVKDWLIDMEDAVYYALSKGLTSYEDIVSFVKKSIGVCDEDYICEYLLSYYYDDEYLARDTVYS